MTSHFLLGTFHVSRLFDWFSAAEHKSKMDAFVGEYNPKKLYFDQFFKYFSTALPSYLVIILSRQCWLILLLYHRNQIAKNQNRSI